MCIERRDLVSTKNKDQSENKQVTTYDYTQNQKVLEAQKEYEIGVDVKRNMPGSERYNKNSSESDAYVSSINKYRNVDGEIKNKNIDMSELYERSARGGAATSVFSQEFGASQDDLAQLMDTRDIFSSRGIKYKIADITGNAANTMSHYVYSTSSSGTDFGTGMRQVADIASPAAFVITDGILMSANKTLQKNLTGRLNQLASEYGVFGNGSTYIGNTELGLTKKELDMLQKELIKKLSDSGLKGVSGNTSGEILYNQINRFLKENEALLLNSEKGAAMMLKEVGRVKMLNDKIVSKRRMFRGNIRMRLFRFMQQDAAGQGFVLTYTMYKRGFQTLKYGLRSLAFTSRALANAGKLAMRASAKAAAMAAQSRLAQKMAATDTGKKVVSGVKTGKKKVRNAYSNTKRRVNNGRIGKIRNTVKDRYEKMRAFTRDPFKLKQRRNMVFNRLRKTRAGKFLGRVFSPYRWIREMLARLLSGMMAALSALVSVLLSIFAVFMGLVIIVVVAISIFMAVVSFFDLSSSDETVIKNGLLYIKELSEEQNEELQRMSANYANVRIAYESEKNEEAYNDPDNLPDRPVIETTNSAEIMSMAQVYFDFDLESVEEDKLKDYIKKLYNASHLITVTEHQRTYTDANGNERTVTDADIAFKTYYFDELFNCRLSNSGGVGVVAGNLITDKVWNYLRTAGVDPVQTAGIMGNMYAESGFDPEAVEHGSGIGLGLCQWSYGRREALENFASSQGKSPGDLEVQLDYFMTEYNSGSFNSYYTGLDNYAMFTSASTPEDAAYYFMWGWERPSVEAGESSLLKRQTAAKTYYDSYIDRPLVTE